MSATDLHPIYHVVPHAVPGSDGGWAVVREGFAGPLAHFARQEEALAFARARAADVPAAEVLVHDPDGGLTAAWRYGDGPR